MKKKTLDPERIFKQVYIYNTSSAQEVFMYIYIDYFLRKILEKL